MAKGDEITTRFSVDISDLKKGISEANQQIKLANAEFKAATAGMDDWASSADGIRAKLSQLESTLDAQKKRLAAYTEELDRNERAYEQNGQRASELRAALQELADKGVDKNSQEYKKLQNALEATEREQEKNRTAADKLKITVLEQQAAVSMTDAEFGKYSSALDEAEKAEKETEDAANDLSDSVNDASDAAEDAGDGFTVFKGALASLVADGIRMAISAMKGFVKESIEVGMAFDASMSKVAAVSGAAGDDLQALRDKAKEMGATTKFSASEAADAMNYMAMAGWKTEDMLDGIGGIMNLAAASGEDLATTSDIVTDALTAFGLTAADSSRFADILAAASSNANTNVGMMGETFKYVAPVCGSMGVSAEDAAEAIGLMANSGIKASQAGTALRSILTRIATDAGASNKSLGALGTLTEELGVQFYNADGSTRDFTDVLAECREAWAELTDEEQANYGKKIAGQEGISAWNALMNASAADVDKLSAAINNSTGAAERMAKTMQDNLSGDLTTLNSKFEGVQIELSEKLTPALRAGVEVLSSLLNGVSWAIDHGEEIIGVLVGIATAVGTYVAFNAALIVMKNGWMALEIVQKAVAAAQWLINAAMEANPIGIIISLIAGLVAAFITLWNTSEDFRNFWIGLWEKIQEASKPIIEALSEWFSKAWDKIKEVWETVYPFFVRLWEGIKETFEEVKPYLEAIFKAAWEAIKIVWNVVTAYFSAIWDTIKGIFAVVKAVLSGDWEAAWEAIKGIVKSWAGYFQTIWDSIKKVFSVVASWFGSVFGKAWESIKEKFASWASFWKGLWDKVTGTFVQIGQTIGNAIEGAIKGAINSALSFVENSVNNIIKMINGVIAVINTLGAGIPEIGLISLPRLAKGGVLSKGQVGLLEGSGAEAVVPLDENKAWISAVAADMVRALGASPAGASADPGAASDGFSFTQVINSPQPLTRIEIYRQTRNLLQLAHDTGGI